MGFYSQVVFPRLCDLLLSRRFIADLRRQVLATSYGDVLEIGFGTGLNLACYPKRIRKLTVVDPNPGMHELARRRTQRTPIEVEWHLLGGERLPFADERFDCVVSTFTLCSIDQVDQALREVHRVLKLGGRFLLLEHGLCPDATIQKWQRRLNWIEQRLGDGCRLDRDMRQLIAPQQFSAIHIDEMDLEFIPRTHGHLYRGQAIK